MNYEPHEERCCQHSHNHQGCRKGNTPQISITYFGGLGHSRWSRWPPCGSSLNRWRSWLLRNRCRASHRHRSGLCVPLKSQQIGANFRSVLVTEIAVLLKRLIDNGSQSRRQLRIERWRQRGRTVKNGIENGSRSIAAEGHRSGRHFIKYSTKREQIGAGIKLLSQCLFWGHVHDGAHGRTWTGQILRWLCRHAFRNAFVPAVRLLIQRQLCQSEVENLGVPTLGDKNVRRLNVEM